MLISRLVSRQVSGWVSRLFSRLVAGLVCVISFVPSIAAVAGGEPHSRNHQHHGRGGSVNVHGLSFLKIYPGLHNTIERLAGISK
jgi:hypothetical protein